MEDDLLRRLSDLIEDGKASRTINKGQDGVDELTARALQSGVPPSEVLGAMLVGMTAIGRRFTEGTAFVPSMLLAARAMKAGMAHLKPYFSSGAIECRGTLVVGTVFGDLHDIGKNLLAMMVEGAGWQVVDLGVDVQPSQFLAALDAHPNAVVGVSALLTTTMGNMREVVKTLRDASPVNRIIVGGAPLTPVFADDINADGYAPTPTEAITLLNTWVTH